MNVILLTGLIFTVVQVESTNNWKKPCQPDIVLDNDQNFLKKHIIHDDFDLNNQNEWKRYLKANGLWNRTLIQSFLPENHMNDVEQICSPSGLRVKSNRARNLCSSKLKMLVYEVKVSNNQEIAVKRHRRHVIVACSMVHIKNKNRCLPVHYEGNRYLNITKSKCITCDIERKLKQILSSSKRSESKRGRQLRTRGGNYIDLQNVLPRFKGRGLHRVRH